MVTTGGRRAQLSLDRLGEARGFSDRNTRVQPSVLSNSGYSGVKPGLRGRLGGAGGGGSECGGKGGTRRDGTGQETTRLSSASHRSGTGQRWTGGAHRMRDGEKARRNARR